MYCKKCGNQISDDAEFCTYCGVRLKGPRIEDVIREEQDADGDEYIAVRPFETDVRTDERQDTKLKREVHKREEEEDVEPVKFQSFVEDENEGGGNKKLIWIAVILALTVIMVGVAVYFSVFRARKNNKVALSEQTHANAQEITTAKQVETQVQEQKNGVFDRAYSDGSKYSGNFADGLWDGKGVYTSPSGVIYSGTFTKGAITGSGTIKYTTGDEYQGSYKNGQRDGKGVLFYKDGTKYKGSFVVDKRSGQGEIWYTNGDYFKGAFVNGMKQGYGEYAFANGSIYKGNYESDVPEGDGIFNYANGDMYIGLFKNGAKNGRGEYHRAGGDIIRGTWTSDDITGNFTYFNSQTGVIEDSVYFENGVKK